MTSLVVIGLGSGVLMKPWMQVVLYRVSTMHSPGDREKRPVGTNLPVIVRSFLLRVLKLVLSEAISERHVEL